MLKIPKIIHQVFEHRNGENFPEQLLKTSFTWRKNHPGWEYRFWDRHAINAFMNQHYPHYINRYFRFKYPVQRWDSIRYP
jgi:mannosyltransferase OCH1-like enzyme